MWIVFDILTNFWYVVAWLRSSSDFTQRSLRVSFYSKVSEDRNDALWGPQFGGGTASEAAKRRVSNTMEICSSGRLNSQLVCRSTPQVTATC